MGLGGAGVALQIEVGRVEIQSITDPDYGGLLVGVEIPVGSTDDHADPNQQPRLGGFGLDLGDGLQRRGLGGGGIEGVQACVFIEVFVDILGFEG